MKKLILIFCVLGMAKMGVAQTNTFPSSGNVGIGTTSPAAKISFGQVDAMSSAEGITWFDPVPTLYGIHRTAGTWSAPNYQQIRIAWDTGIILSPGSGYGKSFVDVQGDGLRVSSGNVGVGITAPLNKLHIYTTTSADGLSIDGTVNPGIVLRSGGALRGFAPGIVTNTASYFTDSSIGDIAFRAESGKILLGIGAGNSAMAISSGNVGIGTTSPTEKLSVNGKIRAKEIKVETSGWSDFVFAPQYKLRGLKETEQFIRINGHLPEIPSAKDVAENGINVGEMNAKLLQKIEELTLYVIDLKKENEQIKKENKEQLDSLSKRLKALEK